MTTKLFALWKHDNTFLGGEIVKMDEDGDIQTKEYGGCWFTPARIFPLKKGKETLERFEYLEECRHKELKTVNDKYDKVLNSMKREFNLNGN